MIEITADIRALIDKAAAGMELAGDEYIDPADGLITVRSAAARGRLLCHALGNRATSCPAVSASASGRPRNSAKPRGTAAPHGAYQAPEGPGLARPLSVRLHLCQRQRPKSSDGQGPRAYVENWKEAYKNNTGLLLFWGCGNRQVLFRRLYRQRPA